MVAEKISKFEVLRLRPCSTCVTIGGLFPYRHVSVQQDPSSVAVEFELTCQLARADRRVEIIGEGIVIKHYLVEGKEKTITYTCAIRTQR